MVEEVGKKEIEGIFSSSEKEPNERNLESLLTRLEVTPQKELLAGFRNLGVVYFPNWDHWFVTHILGRRTDTGDALREREKEWRRVYNYLKNHPVLSKYERKTKEKYWTIWALKCLASLADELSDDFIKGHYTPQARWRLRPPGRMYTLDETLVYGLKRQKQIRLQIDEFKNRISEYFSGRNLTKAFNDIDIIFDDYNGTNWDKVAENIIRKKSLNCVESEIFEKRKEISDQIRITNSRLEDKAVLKYQKIAENKREHELSLEQQNWEYLKGGRMPSASKLLNKKWLFLDIEIPHFRRENAKITWVGITYIENGKARKEIHTIHDTGTAEVDGFRIVRYRNADELVTGLAEKINKENPYFVSSYNAKFDFLKLREIGEHGFLIGDEESNPLVKVTTPFFERIGVKDRFVEDFLRWQKIARGFDINAKLEMAAGFNKPIDYNRLEELEDLAFTGGDAGKKAGFESASYLASDMTHLTDLFFCKDFRNNFEDTLWMSDNFGVGFERLLHSANCINDVQEKGFFSALGIYREEVPPHQRTKKMNDLRSKARADFKESSLEIIAEKDEKKGLFKDVCKVFIPYGDFFRDLIAQRFPDVSKFFEYKDQFKDDKRRLYFLEQYSKEFARWMIEDYGFDLKEIKKFEQIVELKRMDDDFEVAYSDFRENLGKTSEWGLTHLNKANLSTKSVKKHLTEKVTEFVGKYQARLIDDYIGFSKKGGKEVNIDKNAEEMALEAFNYLANQRSKIKRRGRHIIGSYGVFPEDKYFDTDKYRDAKRILIIYKTIEKRLNGIKDYIKQNNLEIICQEGSYMYVQGNTQKLKEKECPLVLVDEIPRLYNADNPYYEKFDFYSHMKLKEEPDFRLNVFEMKAFREMLGSILRGDNHEALRTFRTALETMKAGKIKPDELVFFNKSSGLYSAYLDRTSSDLFKLEHDKGGKVYFVEHEKFASGEIKNDSFGRYFENEEEIRVYIKKQSEIIPNLMMYERKFNERAREILDPIVHSKRRKKEKYDANQSVLNL